MQRQNFASLIRFSRVLSLSLLVVVLGGLLRPEASGQPVSFGAKTDFGTGSVPFSVAVGDFNGDGKLDLAVANRDGDTVSILLGTGTGSFGAKTDFGTGRFPFSLAVGDFNGDGKLDLAVTNFNDSTVSILLGTGTGSLGAKTDFGAGVQPISVAVGDFNGDGKLDLAVANEGPDAVSILLGTGTGSFGANTVFPTGAKPRTVAVGDFNNDGKLDLATANETVSSVSILLGTGTGSFGAKTDFGTGNTPFYVAVGDFNGDGNLDLAVANEGAASVSILLGTGTGSFGAKTDFSTGAGNRPFSLALGDFNGDGKLDVAAVNTFSATVSILLGTGTGGFEPKTDFVTGRGPISVAAGNFNGDGKLDLATANFDDSTVSILLNNSTAPPISICTTPNFGPAAAVATGNGPGYLAIADFNNDGKLDMAVVNLSDSTVSIQIGNGAGGFTSGSAFATPSTPNSVEAGDFNNDGKLDLAIPCYSGASCAIMLGDGAGGFTTTAILPVPGNARYAALGDFNSDGKLDVAVTDQGKINIRVFFGDGAGNFSAPTILNVAAFPYGLKTIDLNGDGRLDLVTTNFQSCSISVLLGDGNGGFAPPMAFSAGCTPVNLAFADFNHDGKVDVVVGDEVSNGVSVLLGNGAGGFGAPTFLATGDHATTVAAADFNGDNNPDIAVQVRFGNSGVAVMLGDGTGSFSAPAYFSFGVGPFALAAADLNRDGKPDIAVADPSTTNVYVLLNTCSAADTTPPVITCPANAAAANSPGQCSANVNAGAATATDNVDGNVTPTGVRSDGQSLSAPYPVGTTIITWTATDHAGNSASCQQTITVNDTQPPAITCPTPTTATANASCQAAIPNVTGGVTASDNCSGTVTITQSPAAGTLVGLGTTTITVTVKDAANNTSTCTTTFTVSDTTPPVIPNLPGSPQSFNWVNVNTPGSTPSARTGHRMVYDPVRHKVILFGGHDPTVHASGNFVLSSHRNDIWELDTATNVWTNVTPTTGAMPVGRADFGMAYDVARDKVIVFGGEIDGWLTGDTWEWDPAARTWDAKPAASSLAYGGLLGSGMAYDPNRHQVILFGGRAYYDWGEEGTWAWDGTNWNNITPSVNPPPRFVHGMATDLARSKVVMFGGQNPNTFTDTWEWDGSTWTQVALSGAVPPARGNAGMAYDAVRHVTVLFGGENVFFGGYEHNDTWSWNGVAWSLDHPQTSPSLRSTSIVYDLSQSKLVLFSGGAQADTWYSQTTSGLPTITGECSASVTAPVATDNCVGPVTGTTVDPTTYTAQGTYTVHWTYNDGHGNSSTQYQTVIVKDTTPPTVTAPPPVAATTGAAATSCGAVVSDATLGTATASDNCSSVTPIRSGVPAGNNFPVGPTTVSYTATDGSGNTTTATQTVTVTDNTPPTITCPALATATANASCQAAIPNMTGGVTASDNCSGTVTITQSPAAGTMVGLGPHTITLTATDASGNTATCSTTFTVADNTPPAITCSADIAVNKAAGACSAIVNYSTPSATDSCSVASVNCSPPSGSAFPVSTTTVICRATDAAGNTASCTFNVSVVNHPPTLSAGGPYSVNEGSSTILTAAGSDSDGDPLTYAWDLDSNGSFETSGQNATFSAATLDGPSSKTVNVRVTDICGASIIAQATVNVLNVAPTVGAITAPVDPNQANTTINASASFTDPGMLDTHTSVWNWGDGGTTTGAVNETNGSGSVSGSHAYTTAGVYTLTLTVTDKDGGSGQAIFQYVVIYDPTAGFVTGGGWINSPAGAYTPNPSLAGRATFGFVSKYERGATVPTGNTQFNFHVAGMNFNSTSYDWLVIAGARAQYKGTGAINGTGNYAFMLTAIDGQINGGGGMDKFRIKIWDKATGKMFYDNQMGAGDDASPTTAIAGGSIVIHSN